MCGGMPPRRSVVLGFLLTPLALLLSVPPVTAQPARTDLDALMERVLANRDQTWRRLQEYLLSERETLHLLAPDGSRLYGSDREYLWVARDGRAVRSPVRVDGVQVGDAERRRREEAWVREEDERATRRRKPSDAGTTPAETEGGVLREPRFISEVQFLRFRFEPGNYYFVGREIQAGREVLRIEYYPTRLYGDDEPRKNTDAPRRDDVDARERDVETQMDRAFHKVSLVTLWVDPEAAQIVRYTFDNVDFNFLPGRSLARLETARASMYMSQPFDGIWLPESLIVEGAVTLATGTYRAEYTRRFSDYRQADVRMRFRVKEP